MAVFLTSVSCPLLTCQALQEKLWNVAAPLYLKQSDLASAAAKQVSLLRPSPQIGICPEIVFSKLVRVRGLHKALLGSPLSACDRS